MTGLRTATLALVLVIVFGAGTLLWGWWTVPAVALVFGAMVGPGARAGWIAGNAAGLAWAALLGWTSTQGPMGSLARMLGAVMGVPGPLLLAVTVLFAALLAASAGVVGASLRGLTSKRAARPA
jgi:hypothetical protein